MNRIITILVLIPTFCSGQWTQLGNSINGQMANDKCGYSTAISANGSIVAMGSTVNANGGNGAGQVRVFSFANDVWTQIGADLNGESSGDQTGQAVSLSADGYIVAIGEPFNNDLGYTSGQVRVFRNVNNNWAQIGSDLYGDNALAGAGTSVDLSSDGSVVAFGAPNTAVNGVQDFIGNVRVFEQQNDNWIQKGGDINGDGLIIKFGQSVSLSADGNIIAIGQTGDPSDGDTGRVKIYEYGNNEWTQLGNTIMGTAENDEFGHEVSLSSSGTILAVGTYGKNEVKVFELNNGVWTQIGNTMFGENPGDSFGFSLSLSYSGSMIAIGGRFNSTDGTSRGRAYVFENQGGVWTQIDNPIVGVANQDQTGFSIAISQDGSRVATGAILNDDNGEDAGHVRVFENSTIQSIEDIENINLVSMYPNPANELIQIQSKQTINSFKIVSVEGRIVHQKEGLNLSEFSIDIKDLASGTYALILQNQIGVRSLTIVKE
jgi:hypothetical protein